MKHSLAAPTHDAELRNADALGVLLSPDDRDHAARLLRDLAALATSTAARGVLLDMAKAVEQGADLDARLRSATRKHYGKEAA